MERRISLFLSSRREVLAGYLFGSTVSGKLRPGSDIDIAVLVDRKKLRRVPLRFRLDLMVGLGAALHRFDVDVVVLNDAPPALAQNVLTKGRLVYEQSKSARIAFQVRTLNLFMDTEPIRRAQLQSLKRIYSRKTAHG